MTGRQDRRHARQHVEQVASLELYDQPANLFVATFIGSPGMNPTGARLNPAAPWICCSSIVVAGQHKVQDGQPVVYGIRPEHLELSDDGMPATIAVIEPTGSETQVMLRMAESDIVAVFRERHDFQPGQTVHLKPRPEFAHIFDSASGARV